MIKSSSRRAAVVLSGSAIALTAAMLPAQAAASGWRVNSELAVRGGASVVSSVDAVSPRDAWASGFSARKKNPNPEFVLRHWAGKSWLTVRLPAKIAKRWNSSLPVDTQVAASSASDVWIFGGSVGGHYLHRDGKRWSTGSLPGGSGGSLVEILAARGLGKSNAWAFGAKLNIGISS